MQQYQLVLKSFFNDTELKLNEVQTNDIRSYLYNYKKRRGISDRTLEQQRTHLYTFFEWCCNEHYIESNPARNITPIKYAKKERKPLTPMEMEKLRKCCCTVRQKAIIEMLYSTGCRVSELSGLNKTDIDLVTGEVNIFGKSSKYRTSYMSAKAIISITDYLNARMDNNPALFVYCKKPYSRLTKDGIEKEMKNIVANFLDLNKHVTPHVLRHTFAQTMLDRGAALTDIQQLLGHATVSTTQVYAKNNIEKAKIAHDRFIT